MYLDSNFLHGREELERTALTLMPYCEYLTDFDLVCEYGAYRISVLRHNDTGKVYWRKMYNGRIVEWKEVGQA